MNEKSFPPVKGTVLEQFRLPVKSEPVRITQQGEVYSGAPVGLIHHWDYTEAKWDEQKVRPDLWNVKFTSIKRRRTTAPEGSGVEIGTRYNWYIIGNQIVEKLNANSYSTELNAMKFKIGHKRPHWSRFSYEYIGQKSEKERIIMALEEAIRKLKER